MTATGDDDAVDIQLGASGEPRDDAMNGLLSRTEMSALAGERTCDVDESGSSPAPVQVASAG